MDTAPIKSVRDYKRALEEIEGMMNAQPNTPGGARLDDPGGGVMPDPRRHHQDR